MALRAVLSADRLSGGASSLSFHSIRNASPEQFRKSADIVSIGKTILPPVADYADRCAALIRETFPASSQHQMCLDAARYCGASPDTFDRILNGLPMSPDARLMLCVAAIHQARSGRPFNLGGGFAVRLTMEGTP